MTSTYPHKRPATKKEAQLSAKATRPPRKNFAPEAVPPLVDDQGDLEAENMFVADLAFDDQEHFDSTIIVEALKLVYGERRAQYGHPHPVYVRARVMWGIILGVTPTWDQFGYCIEALKMCRELVTPHPDNDNNRDIIGWQAAIDECKRYERMMSSSDG